MGYGFFKKDGQLLLYTNTSEEIPIDWKKEIKPFYQMGLIAIGRETRMGVTYIPLSEEGKRAYKYPNTCRKLEGQQDEEQFVFNWNKP